MEIRSPPLPPYMDALPMAPLFESSHHPLAVPDSDEVGVSARYPSLPVAPPLHVSPLTTSQAPHEAEAFPLVTQRRGSTNSAIISSSSTLCPVEQEQPQEFVMQQQMESFAEEEEPNQQLHEDGPLVFPPLPVASRPADSRPPRGNFLLPATALMSHYHSHHHHHHHHHHATSSADDDSFATEMSPLRAGSPLSADDGAVTGDRLDLQSPGGNRNRRAGDSVTDSTTFFVVADISLGEEAMQWAQHSTDHTTATQSAPFALTARNHSDNPSASMQVRVSQSTPNSAVLLSRRRRQQELSVPPSTLQRQGYWDMKRGLFTWPHPMLRKRREAVESNARRTRVSHRSLEGERARQRLEDYAERHGAPHDIAPEYFLLTERVERRTITRTTSQVDDTSPFTGPRGGAANGGRSRSNTTTSAAPLMHSRSSFVYRRHSLITADLLNEEADSALLIGGNSVAPPSSLFGRVPDDSYDKYSDMSDNELRPASPSGPRSTGGSQQQQQPPPLTTIADHSLLRSRLLLATQRKRRFDFDSYQLSPLEGGSKLTAPACPTQLSAAARASMLVPYRGLPSLQQQIHDDGDALDPDLAMATSVSTLQFWQSMAAVYADDELICGGALDELAARAAVRMCLPQAFRQLPVHLERYSDDDDDDDDDQVDDSDDDEDEDGTSTGREPTDRAPSEGTVFVIDFSLPRLEAMTTSLLDPWLQLFYFSTGSPFLAALSRITEQSLAALTISRQQRCEWTSPPSTDGRTASNQQQPYLRGSQQRLERLFPIPLYESIPRYDESLLVEIGPEPYQRDEDACLLVALQPWYVNTAALLREASGMLARCLLQIRALDNDDDGSADQSRSATTATTTTTEGSVGASKSSALPEWLLVAIAKTNTLVSTRRRVDVFDDPTFVSPLSLSGASVVWINQRRDLERERTLLRWYRRYNDPQGSDREYDDCASHAVVCERELTECTFNRVPSEMTSNVVVRHTVVFHETLDDLNKTFQIQKQSGTSALQLLPNDLMDLVVSFMEDSDYLLLRLVSTRWNHIVTRDCRLWQPRLSLEFTEEDRVLAEECMVHRLTKALERQFINASLAWEHAHCHDQCCYRAWRSTTKTQRTEMELFASERLQLHVVSNILKGIFFPILQLQHDAGLLCILLTSVFAVLALSSHIMLEIAFESHKGTEGGFYSFAFLPTWLSFAVSYPLVYMFFSQSGKGTMAVGFFVCFAQQATCLLAYFYIRGLPSAITRAVCVSPSAVAFLAVSLLAFVRTRQWIHQRTQDELQMIERSPFWWRMVRVALVGGPALLGAAIVLFAHASELRQRSSVDDESSRLLQSSTFVYRVSGICMFVSCLLFCSLLLFVVYRVGVSSFVRNAPGPLTVLAGYILSSAVTCGFGLLLIGGSHDNGLQFGCSLLVMLSLLLSTVANALTAKNPNQNVVTYLIFLGWDCL